MDLLRKVERTNLELGALPNLQICIANIGNVFCATGDYLNAIAHYRRALQIAEKIKDPVSIRKWTHNLHIAFAKSRDQTMLPESPASSALYARTSC
jgi:tetratricopeptide (TPR) repeat protein